MLAMGDPVLRIPPFPGAARIPLAVADATAKAKEEEAAQCLSLLRELRVGGDFWSAGGPWARFEGRDSWQTHASDESALLARIAGLDVRVSGTGRFADCACEREVGIEELVARHLLNGYRYLDPFRGTATTAAEIIALLGDWRRLIDENRNWSGVLGIAGWKRSTVTPLLWDGDTGPRYARRISQLDRPGTVGVWKSRTSTAALHALGQSGRPVAEIEDGFIRSTGLGADCIPPLSIIVDLEGIYFDPARSSMLEILLREAEFDDRMIKRAEALRQLIVNRGIGKYGATVATLPRPAGSRRHILVPGQVEDDRSVLNGGGEVRSNLELLRRARAEEPDAFVIFKPHPDVEAGHRVGHIADDVALQYADLVVRDAPISALLDMVDGLHVLTSLAGFEALLRNKTVTTHGIPFYAGWGLTNDRAAIPARRGRKRSLSELITAALIVYPRYLDPVTMLPCSPEVVIERISEGLDNQPTLLTRARRWQGRLSKILRAGSVK